MCLRPRRIASAFRVRSLQNSTHAFHPSDSLRLAKWRAPRNECGERLRVLRHRPHAIASLRLIMKLSPLRSSCMNSAFIATISTHALSPPTACG